MSPSLWAAFRIAQEPPSSTRRPHGLRSPRHGGNEPFLSQKRPLLRGLAARTCEHSTPLPYSRGEPMGWLMGEQRDLTALTRRAVARLRQAVWTGRLRGRPGWRGPLALVHAHAGDGDVRSLTLPTIIPQTSPLVDHGCLSEMGRRRVLLFGISFALLPTYASLHSLSPPCCSDSRGTRRVEGG